MEKIAPPALQKILGAPLLLGIHCSAYTYHCWVPVGWAVGTEEEMAGVGGWKIKEETNIKLFKIIAPLTEVGELPARFPLVLAGPCYNGNGFTALASLNYAQNMHDIREPLPLRGHWPASLISLCMCQETDTPRCGSRKYQRRNSCIHLQSLF